ncbi:GNAT family N-acetyltransferase [Vibrio aestuarianus]|uniref:GNAT family N-acetyltransferase n=1 Tax=Vibrio aestuarianus TaxID=28171 RepID=A0A9X4J552_9VIBR|nr:GNAT family N-acetyltransferase [Vibrio aestuarianus]MDE1312343.1 GNAT family N-acetyltransferase [Vibrio aestuarianus]MDE1331983.1 GNAT family N-acetyltransferase [Vibrio aestuarianus]MDE1358895.1 GNAT family N-acetyltransferase [Vibrio aestuarianus]NGZ19056.1 GNAT family N-acetyltransferase [Vibrio aestuarianus]NGZ94100.1 GNAT family N-acetyltransferase [Vibrio aestuarianus subsp. cardii]
MFSLSIDSELKLALIESSFAPLYVELVRSQQDYLSQWLAWPPHCQTEQDFQAFIKRSLHDYAEGKAMTCAIFYQDRLVGNCSFNQIDYNLSKVAIGYWLSQQEQGKGIISRVVKMLTDIAFNTLEIDKVEIATAVDNRPSRTVVERLGFSYEGTITNSENLNGRIVDHAIYGLKRPTA